jgi:hypothetical protein
MCIVHHMWMIIFMVVLSLCSTQIFAQGVTVGDTSTSGNSMLNVNGNLAVGSSYYTTAAPANGMIVEGNVGIGTSSPGSFRLNVAGTIRFQNYNATSTNALLLTNTTGDLSKLDLSGSSLQYLDGTGNWSIPASSTGWTLSSPNLYNTANLVGVGTSAPQYRFHVAVASPTLGTIINVHNTGTGNNQLSLVRFTNNSTSGTSGFNSSYVGGVRINDYSGVGNHGYGLVFGVAANGVSNAPIEAMRIAPNGGLSIGSTTNPPTQGLYVQGAVQFNTLTSGLSTNLVTSDASGNLTKYAHGTSGQFLRGDGWQNISTIIPTGTVNQTLRHDGTKLGSE